MESGLLLNAVADDGPLDSARKIWAVAENSMAVPGKCWNISSVGTDHEVDVEGEQVLIRAHSIHLEIILDRVKVNYGI